MFEQAAPPMRQVMLVADAQIVMQALTRSLQNTPAFADEALLHLSDLSGLYSAFGLKTEADYLRQMCSRFAEQADEGSAQLRALMPNLQAIHDALAAHDTPQLNAACKALAVAVQALWAPKLPEQTTNPPTQLQAVQDMAPPTMAPPTPSTAKPATPEFGLPLFSAGLLAQPFGKPETTQAASPGARAQPLPVIPNWSDVRAQALQALQDVGQSLAARPDQDLAEVMSKLGAASDTLSRIGQMPLHNVYPHAALAPSLWVDPSVAQLLEQLHVFSERCLRVTAQQRNQTLFLNWHGIHLSHTESDFLGQKLAAAFGRVESVSNGLMLVLPVSLERMRLVSYRDQDQWLAVSSAQFMGWSRSAESGLPLMKLCAGFDASELMVQETGEAATMNVFPWPSVVPAGAHVAGLALNRAGLVHILRHVAA
jgi:hypothetical protein